MDVIVRIHTIVMKALSKSLTVDEAIEMIRKILA